MGDGCDPDEVAMNSVYDSIVTDDEFPYARSLFGIAFVTRRRRCGQMQGRRPGKTGGVFAGIR
jgi:hypothetical protein